MTRRKFGYLGALSAVIIAAGCGGADTSQVDPSGGLSSAEEELGESFTSCVAADAAAWSGGVLTINASSTTTGVVIVSPGGSVVKVNGRTCKTAAGATIALSAVSKIAVTGKSASSDTFVLDFSAGLPTGSLLSAGGITLNGGETVATTTTPDTVIIKGSTKADPITVGLDAADDGTVDISLSATKAAHVQLKQMGRKAQGPYQPNLVFSLGGGDDTFSGVGGFGTPAATAMNYGMSVYGGAGNDTIIGGTGADKIDGGGQAGDTLDYSGRTTSDVYADIDSTHVTVWGGSLRGVSMVAGEKFTVNPGDGAHVVTFAGTENTPALIAAAINAAATTVTASVVGGRLRLTSTDASHNFVAISSGAGIALTKLGLVAGYYATLGNDGTPGTAIDVPATAPSVWVPGGTYAVGAAAVPGVGLVGNGFWYKATAITTGTAGTAEPTWPTTIGATVTDSGVTWTCMGRVSRPSTTAPSWATGTIALGAIVQPTSPDGYWYKATTGGAAGASEPDWTAASALGATVTDGAVVWTRMGTVPLAWSAGATFAAGQTATPSTPNGYWYKTTGGTSDGSTEPASWPTTVGSTVTDNGMTWTCMGTTANTYLPGDSVWDITNSALYTVDAKSKSDGSAPTFDTTPGNTVNDTGTTGIVWTTIGAFTARANSTPYAVGVYVTSGGYYYQAVAKLAATGISASSLPTMPTTVGTMVTDGTVVWKCLGPVAALATAQMYSIGDVASAGGYLAKVTSLGTLSTSSAVAFASTPANKADGNFQWTYQASGLGERDDVQGIEVITGGTGNDILIGNTLANTINGGDGNDILMGGPYMTVSASCPMDKLNGGNGNDWFDMGIDDANLAAPTKHDCSQTIAGGAGLDVVDYSQRSSYGNLLVKMDGSTASGEQSTSTKEGDKIGTDVEILLGGAGNDVITGGANNDYLFGGPGDDTISAGAGDDYIYGGSGNDKLYGEAGSDTFFELAAYPTATAWNEPLNGGTTPPGTWAGVGLAVYGSDKPADGDDLVLGGPDLTEVNKVDFSDAANAVKIAICSSASATPTALGSCTTANSDYVGISTDGTTSVANSYINIEYVVGAFLKANTIIGSVNAETFEGGVLVDTLLGQGGQDTIFGYPDPGSGIGVDNVSADKICGGDDDDLVYGGTATTLEGEGQMDQARANQATTAVLLSGSAVTPQTPADCVGMTGFAVTPGVNACFGAVATKTHCAN